MDSPKAAKGKKGGLISKTWERCKSFSGAIGRKAAGKQQQQQQQRRRLGMKSKSWPRGLIDLTVQAPIHQETKKASLSRVAPEGCFSIYVGPQKQRFMIKTEYVNHPLFKILLEEAESEYGYSSEGPLLLPCEVDHFIKVLMEMDSEDINIGKRRGCNFVARSHTSYHLLTPPRLVAMNYFPC